MGTQYLEAIYYGVQDGLQEMADSPEALIKEAALGAAVGMGLTIGAPVSGAVGMAGILFSIQSFYQSYQELRDMEDNYARLREVARMVTVSVVESIASGVIIKAGTTVKEVATEVSMLVKDTKVWQSACDWLKRNVKNIADVAGGAFKGTVDAILAKVRSGKNLVIYKYISQKADDIYAELKDILDADALNYLQRVFYNKNVNTHISDFRLLVDTADSIKLIREIVGRNLTLDEIEYICQSTANKKTREIINKVFHFLANDDLSTLFNGDAFRYLKQKYSDVGSLKHISKIIESAVSASEAKGKYLNLSDIRYLVKAVTAKVPQETIDEMLQGISPRKTYYTVQGSKDARRLRENGIPWKTGSTEAHFGEGVYAWGNREDAEEYLKIVSNRDGCIESLEILEFEVLDSDFNKMRKKLLAGHPDDEVNEFMDKYSKLSGATKKPNYDYISRSTGMGDENYFNKTVFARLRFE